MKGETLMLKVSTKLRRRCEAKEQLSELEAKRSHVIAIHYSCESFCVRPDGTSPRITSIAARNLATAQTTSFSIHQFAERDKISIEDINEHYDELEKRMLEEFYDYAKRCGNHIWLHWNMRDINYGFQALEHRLKTLGGKPLEIPESHRRDLARLLQDLYGSSYVRHPRLEGLVEKNDITHPHFLSGQAEAEAFKERDYVKLHQSTLRKVHVISDIIDLTSAGRLKTDARLKEIYGGYFTLARTRGLRLIMIGGSVASILALVLWLLK